MGCTGHPRGGTRLGSVVVALLAMLVPTASASAAGGSWNDPGFLAANVRVSFVSALLADGRVFVAGGANGPTGTDSAELLDSAATGWSPTGSMSVPRSYFSSALLNDGRVLVAGGAPGGNGQDAQPSAELWNPGSGAFSSTGAMNVARQSFSLTALPDGRALAVGGSPNTSSGGGSPTSELFDPATNSWTPSGSMQGGRLGHTATLLPSCLVLIDGDNPTSELYNYAAGTFSQTGSESPQRSYHTATLLPSGKVLIAGGVDGSNQPLATASLYDPSTGSFSPAGAMSVPRSQAVASLLRDGRVLVAGGFTSTTPVVATNSADVYDPLTNSWSPAPDMPYPTDSAQAQTLADGRVAVIGGDPSGRRTQIYTPDNIGRPDASVPAPDCSGLSGGADTTAPDVALSGKKRQKLGRAIAIGINSSESGEAAAAGKIIVLARGAGREKPDRASLRKTTRRQFKLRSRHTPLVAGETRAFKLGPSPKARRQVRQLARRGATGRAIIKVTVTDAAGNATATRRVVQLR